MKQIMDFLARLFKWEPELPIETTSLPPSPMPEVVITEPVQTKSNREKLYETAVRLAKRGIDVSPSDTAPDSLACVDSLNAVYRECFGTDIKRGIVSTKELYELMLIDPRFEKIIDPMPGDIVISPTGYSRKAPHGHTGIWGKTDVMSNDSTTGMWLINYTHQAWYNVFAKTLGFPVFFFRVR